MGKNRVNGHGPPPKRPTPNGPVEYMVRLRMALLDLSVRFLLDGKMALAERCQTAANALTLDANLQPEIPASEPMLAP